MRLDWLSDAAAETGYPVIEVDGWESRGKSDSYSPSTVVAHHTAGPSGNGDMPSLGIIVNGRSDLPGPLANYGLGRSGSIYVVAAGKANNAGEGDWDGCASNYCTVGIEAENDGRQPWPLPQLDSYARLSAAILNRLGRQADKLCGHKEWAPSRKVDPHSIDMNKARTTVQSLLEGDDMAWHWDPDDPQDIEDLHDADLVFEFQGTIFAGNNVATYLANLGNPDSEEKEFRTGILLGHAREVQELMLQGERLSNGGL